MCRGRRVFVGHPPKHSLHPNVMVDTFRARANSLHIGGYPMKVAKRCLSRRDLFKSLGAATSGIALGRWLEPDVAVAQELVQAKAMETFTGPRPNPYWNSVGPYVSE